MSLKGTIMAVVRQVGEHGDYIVVTHEMRTRYAVIDPILEALGWDLANPSQVRVEHVAGGPGEKKRVDYALFSEDSKEKPMILLEAKKLSQAQVNSWEKNREREKRRIQKDWEDLSSGKPLRPPKRDSWQADLKLALTADEIKQLEDYVKGLRLTEGYAVLTNGAEWIVYDLSIRGRGVGFDKKQVSNINILSLHSLDECVEALGVLRRPLP